MINRYNSLLGPVAPFDYGSRVVETLRIAPLDPGVATPFLWAGASEENDRRGRFVGMLYSGKIDRAGVANRALPAEAIEKLARGELPPLDAVIAHWDTTAGYTDAGIGDTIDDIGPHRLHAEGINRPIRGMTGWNWAGRADSFRLDPKQYGGIAFHDDALTDCLWSSSLTLRIPDDIKSGVYALRLRAGEAEDHIPFFIRAAKPKAPLAVLMSTFTYLAYANERLAFDAPIAQAITAHTPIFTEADVDFYKLQEFGLSTYDHHSDGAGCCYSSWRRPIINIRPRHRNERRSAYLGDCRRICRCSGGSSASGLRLRDPDRPRPSRRGRRGAASLSHGHQLHPSRVLFGDECWTRRRIICAPAAG